MIFLQMSDEQFGEMLCEMQISITVSALIIVALLFEVMCLFIGRLTSVQMLPPGRCVSALKDFLK